MSPGLPLPRATCGAREFSRHCSTMPSKPSVGGPQNCRRPDWASNCAPRSKGARDETSRNVARGKQQASRCRRDRREAKNLAVSHKLDPVALRVAVSITPAGASGCEFLSNLALHCRVRTSLTACTIRRLFSVRLRPLCPPPTRSLRMRTWLIVYPGANGIDKSRTLGRGVDAAFLGSVFLMPTIESQP